MAQTILTKLVSTPANSGSGTQLTNAGTIINAGLSNVDRLNNYTSTQKLALSSYPGISLTPGTNNLTAFKAFIASIAGTTITGVIDFPCTLTIGHTPANMIFMPSNTNLECTGTGALLVDNQICYGFIFNNTANCDWVNMVIQYTGSVVLDISTSTYSGVYGATNTVITNDMSTNWGNTFSGGGGSLPNGYNNTTATIGIRGAANNLNFYNLQMIVPPNTAATNFFTVCVDIDPQWTPGTNVTTNNQPFTATYATQPTNINFYNPVFDGFCMGFTGSGGVRIHGARFYRYSDIQGTTPMTFTSAPTGTGGTWNQNWTGADGASRVILFSDGESRFVTMNNGSPSITWTPALTGTPSANATFTDQGGINNYFAPPHAVYLPDSDVSFGTNCAKELMNCFDYGNYVGYPVRRNATSGSLLSLKISPGSGTSIDGYTSLRDDGFIDFPIYNAGTYFGTFRNLIGVYTTDTVCSDFGCVWGIRWPTSPPYSYMVIENLSIRDKSLTPRQFPIRTLTNAGNNNCSFTNIKVYMNDWPTAATGDPAMGFAGNNMSLEAKYYFNNFNDTDSYDNLFNSGNVLTNSNVDVTVYGFRLATLLFNLPLAANATSGTLANNWAFPTGTYLIQFSDNEIRYTTLTNGSKTVNWSANGGGLSNAVTATASAQNLLFQNYNNYRARIQALSSGKGIGNRIRVLDVTNSNESIVEDGVRTDYYSQIWSGAPTGSTFTVPISIPASMQIDRYSWSVTTSLGTGNSLSGGVNVGYTSGSATALFSAVASNSGTNPAQGLSALPLSGSGGKQILLTPVSGSFDGTGNVIIVVRASMMYGGE